MLLLVLRTCVRSGGSGGIRARGVLSAQGVPPRLSSSLSSLSAYAQSTSPLCDVARSFSSSGDGNNSNSNVGSSNEKDDDQSILLHDEDSLPAPPSYVRDAVTGKWTDRTHPELTPDDRRLVNLDEEDKSEEVMKRLGERWKGAASEAGVVVGDTSSADDTGDDGFGTLNEEHERVARRIQEQQLALGTIGRDPAASVKKGISAAEDDDTDNAKSTGDDAAATIERPLTPREYQALKTYAQKEHNVNPKDFARMAENDPDLIPHNAISSGSEGSTDSKQFFDADLDLAYLNPKLNRRAFREEGAEHEDPFADLLPSDLNPARKVNRRHAKPIPRRLLHHNNLALLRRYTTPGGKIMNRVQSRLGAREQRKIAKLVKRSRHLGLIPHLGQWKFEDHGHLYEKGLDNADSSSVKYGDEVEGKRDWEVELEKRGLWPLADETELVKRYYDMDRMIEHIAGPKGGKKRDELERLLGGMGALVAEQKKTTEGSDEQESS